MVKAGNWTQQEVEACVVTYLRMLVLELNGQHYRKISYIQELVETLGARNSAAIQYKFSNISAILIELGYPYIEGYKPMYNYQKLLLDLVEAALKLDIALQEAAQHAVTRPAAATSMPLMDSVWVEAPIIARKNVAIQERIPHFSPVRRDYLAQEARNYSLGRAGEVLVVELEKRRLHAAGCKREADRVEHVAETRGDGLGYDVLSYDTNGRERFIEVKATAFGKLTPFYVTKNELLRSERDALQYHLYRVFNFRLKPQIFNMQGSIGAHFKLEASHYLARL